MLQNRIIYQLYKRFNGGGLEVGIPNLGRGRFECDPEWIYPINETTANTIGLVKGEALKGHLYDNILIRDYNDELPEKLPRDFYGYLAPNFYQNQHLEFTTPHARVSLYYARTIFPLAWHEEDFSPDLLTSLDSFSTEIVLRDTGSELKIGTHFGADFHMPYMLKLSDLRSITSPHSKPSKTNTILRTHSLMPIFDYVEWLCQSIGKLSRGETIVLA